MISIFTQAFYESCRGVAHVAGLFIPPLAALLVVAVLFAIVETFFVRFTKNKP